MRWSNMTQGTHQLFDNQYIGCIFINVQCQIVTPAMRNCMSRLAGAIFLRPAIKIREILWPGLNRVAPWGRRNKCQMVAR